MITSFTVTLIECLEIALITLLLAQVSTGLRLYIYGIIGLVGGVFAAIILHDFVEDYEWVGYGILSLMLFYLFFRGKDMAQHVKEHIEEIKTATGMLVVFVTVVTVYARESFEIVSALLFDPNSHYGAAGLGALLAILIYSVSRRNKKITGFVFKWGHWVYLGLALWFGYECIEYLNII